MSAPGMVAAIPVVPAPPAAEFGSILSHVDSHAVSEAARRESRNREVHLPPLSTFRWWARRTGAVNAAVLEAATEALGTPVLDVLDPFAGGGTIPLVALRGGHRVQARDLNPWAAAGVEQMLDPPDPEQLGEACERLGERAGDLLESAYTTTMADGEPGRIAHTMRVAIGRCSSCGSDQRQFPYATLTLKHRRERKRPEAILACPAGHIFEGSFGKAAQRCPVCERRTDPEAFYTTRRLIECAECGHSERLSDRAAGGPWDWEVVLIERAAAGYRELDSYSSRDPPSGESLEARAKPRQDPKWSRDEGSAAPRLRALGGSLSRPPTGGDGAAARPRGGGERRAAGGGRSADGDRRDDGVRGPARAGIASTSSATTPPPVTGSTSPPSCPS